MFAIKLILSINILIMEKSTFLSALLFSFFLVLSSNGEAQVINGNFETSAGAADISGWTSTCGGLFSVADTPLGGGNFSVRVTSGNTQSCFPGYVYQIIALPNLNNVVKVEGWAKVDSSFTPFGSVGIYIAKMDALSGNITILFGDSSTSTNWTKLNAVGNVTLFTNEYILVLLDAGLTGGPALGYAYFDLIEATVQESNCELSVEDGDICVENSLSGVVLAAPNGNCFRIRVANDGSLTTEAVSCP